MTISKQKKQLIVGLGNPGTEYETTRHNIGFMILDSLANELKITYKRDKKAAIATKRSVIFLKPQTFMNNSGLAVQSIVKQHQVELNNILVVYDDINIPLGQIRVRGQGSAGGHNGLESIIQTLNSRDIARVRCGIKEEKPVKNRVNYVLSPFSKKDIPLVEEMIEMAKKVVYTFIRHGLAKTMNSYNKKIIAPQN